MSEVPLHLLERRRKTGADRFDEVWDGVLHMVPSPTVDHQDLEWQLEAWLREHWAKPTGGRVYHQVNVAPAALEEWTTNYRVPDIVLIGPDRLSINRNTHLAGGPDVAVEIRSPRDEAIEKLPFYAEIGVREVW